jgi:hypothetical protein
MKQLLYALLFSFLLSSCATIFNTEQTTISIFSNDPVNVKLNEDTVIHVSFAEEILVYRSPDPLRLTVFNDSLSDTISLNPKNSLDGWLKIYPSWLSPIGFLSDTNNVIYYSYPRRLFVDLADPTGEHFSTYPFRRRGNVNLHFSLPYINNFLLNPEGEGRKLNTGFMGLAFGVDYYHSRDQFVNVGVAGGLDFIIPFPASINSADGFELMRSGHVSVSNNHNIGRLSMGYGLTYARNVWEFRGDDFLDSTPPEMMSRMNRYDALGFIFPTYFQIRDIFHVGIIYRPTFFRPSLTNQFAYEHLISIDFALKIGVRTK